MSEVQDAWETIRFAIFNDLIGKMPPGSYDYLDQASRVAVEALKDSQYAWVFKTISDENNS
jgi:hypothetical protein